MVYLVFSWYMGGGMEECSAICDARLACTSPLLLRQTIYANTKSMRNTGQPAERVRKPVACQTQKYAPDLAMRAEPLVGRCAAVVGGVLHQGGYLYGGKRGVAKQALTSNAPYCRWRAEGQRPRPGKKNRGCPGSHKPHHHGHGIAPRSYYKVAVTARAT